MYQPAETIERVSVGALVDRLESKGRWPIEIDMALLDSDNWRRIIAMRSEYLERQRSVLLKDM